MNYFDIVVVIDYLFGNIVIDDLQVVNSELDYNHTINIIDILLILDLYYD